jgi:hypothetical protein
VIRRETAIGGCFDVLFDRTWQRLPQIRRFLLILLRDFLLLEGLKFAYSCCRCVFMYVLYFGTLFQNAFAKEHCFGTKEAKRIHRVARVLLSDPSPFIERAPDQATFGQKAHLNLLRSKDKPIRRSIWFCIVLMHTKRLPINSISFQNSESAGMHVSFSFCLCFD